MARPTPPMRIESMRNTPEGKALLDLLFSYPTARALADAIGIKPGLLGTSMIRGRVSRSIAILIEQNLGIKKELMRPDLTEYDWQAGIPGKQIGATPERSKYDQETLRLMAAHYGSVRSFCEAASIPIGTFHNWNSRGRIAAWAIPRLCALDVTDEIRARLLSDGGEHARGGSK